MTTHLDIFAGIGGFSIAAHEMGWQTIAFVEKEPFAQTILRESFGRDSQIYDDVFTFSINNVVNAFDNHLDLHQLQEVSMAARRKDYDQAVHLYQQGFSIGNVASFYGISRQAMWAILKRRGCEFRPRLKYGPDNHFYRGTSAEDRVHNICEQALKKGILTRPVLCENCRQPSVLKDGRSGIQAHHCDYNKPLEVMWLCQKCHHQWHKENQAIPLKEAQGAKEVNRLYSVDILTGGFP